ncbi:hypothetical protein MFMK1_001484 [Metallumcola ferriviriculae]|uniref:Uncharacterized protein n=1 Tax=Metallumcola ferriviriculae TaxID=3039180 RepID=A0AAU0UNB4_9FIRM|nr:hypothetical protein MFMK1_001484 [Desulfitibacteraceae bacterium MK1]
MKFQKNISILVFCIIIVSLIATTSGILSNHGPGAYEYQSVRGETVTIYGRGLYQHMSSEVAVQGIAQDYVTLFIGIPLLIAALFLVRKGSVKGKFLLTGVLGYFLVTYLFYLVMAMYNPLFLAYAFLMGASFFGFTLAMFSFEVDSLPESFKENTPVKSAGVFLVAQSFLIAFLWLSIVVPPLINGEIYPQQVEHYTTLIVQGMDLGLLLPAAIISGILLIKKQTYGYLLGPVYFVFLSILMTALTAKVIAMGISGYNIIPVIFIIPTFALISIFFSVLLIKNVIGKPGSAEKPLVI